MFTIVGAGFGIYGYLPALVEHFDEGVLLPQAYRSHVEARPELARYLGNIRWATDADAALRASSGVVIATRPQQQCEVVARCAELPTLRKIVIEKPVAVTPTIAAGVLQSLERAGKRYRVGYSLLHTAWTAQLPRPRAVEDAASVYWSFMAHHFAQDLGNWKRHHDQGGGALRFFGVHVVALLAQQGYCDVRKSRLIGEQPAEPERWEATVTGPGLPPCLVTLDSRATHNRFAVTLGTEHRVELTEPFELEVAATPGDDRRITVLRRLLASFDEDDVGFSALYADANQLWQRAEDATVFGLRSGS